MQKNSGNYKKYKSSNPLMKIVIRNFLKNIGNMVVNLDTDWILDAGCGEGFVLDYIQSNKVVGIDISRSSLAMAQSKCKSSSFCMASAYNLPFPDRTFSLILALELLEHLEEPEKCLEEIRRVSAGHLIFSVPDEPYFQIMNMLRGKNIARFGNDPEHLNNWSFGGFKELVEVYFDVVEEKRSFPWTILHCVQR